MLFTANLRLMGVTAALPANAHASGRLTGVLDDSPSGIAANLLLFFRYTGCEASLKCSMHADIIDLDLDAASTLTSAFAWLMLLAYHVQV